MRYMRVRGLDLAGLPHVFAPTPQHAWGPVTGNGLHPAPSRERREVDGVHAVLSPGEPGAALLARPLSGALSQLIGWPASQET